MKRINLNLIIVVVIAGAVFFIKKETRPAVSRAVAAKELAKPAATQMVSKAAALVKPAPAVAVVEKPRPYAEELKRYGFLKKKIYLSKDEQGQKDLLLKNGELLLGMRSRLIHTPSGPEEAMEQNAALDLLMEAMIDGDNETAMEVLRGVVSDPLVEDVRVDRATRQNLAEVKAEVLYQWSSLKPGYSEELAGLLPGPVSRNIWQNVVDTQESNLAESSVLGR